jgi:hypothetical protein
MLLAIHFQVIETAAKLLNIYEKCVSRPWKMSVKNSFTGTACRPKIKIVYTENYLKSYVSVKTRPKKTRVSTNFNKADYQIVTSRHARFLPVFLFFALIICNTLMHSTLHHLKRSFIKKALFSA